MNDIDRTHEKMCEDNPILRLRFGDEDLDRDFATFQKMYEDCALFMLLSKENDGEYSINIHRYASNDHRDRLLNNAKSGTTVLCCYGH